MVKASDLYFLPFSAESRSNENIMKVYLFSNRVGRLRFSEQLSSVFSLKYFSERRRKSDSFMPSISLRAPIFNDLKRTLKCQVY